MDIFKLLSLLLILFLRGPAYAQIKVEGYIVDEQKQPIGFVNIRSAKTLLSTATDQKGYFKIALPDSRDSVLITHLGYSPLGYAAGQITAGSRIVMQRQSTLLNEVTVSGKPEKKSLLNPFSKQGALEYDFGELVAQEYRVDGDGVFLDQARIHFYRDDRSSTGSVKFKFLVYDTDPAGIGPGRLLAEKHCTVTDLRTGTYMIDFPDPIYISGAVFFLGVEKLIRPINERPLIYTAYNSAVRDSYNIRYVPNIYLDQKGKQKYWVWNTATKKWQADQGTLSIEAFIKE